MIANPDPGARSIRSRRDGRAFIVAAVMATIVLSQVPAAACDICAIYVATEIAEGRTGLRVGVGQQYSRFTRVQDGGEEVGTGAGERIDSSITQLLLAYQLTDRLGLQLNLPVISRTFRRLHDGRTVRGDETGIGDLSVVGNVMAYSRVTDASIFRATLLGGLKLPSGGVGRLSEELGDAVSLPDADGTPRIQPPAPTLRDRLRLRHAGGGDSPGVRPSGVHGHDLALGSGSIDGIVGGHLYWAMGRLFATGAMQYAIRTEGAFSYEFADDVTWVGGPGWYIWLDHGATLALQALLSGETKGKDSQGGRRLDDTAITALYAGPGIVGSWGTAVSAEFAVDLPVIQQNTSVQIVPDVRVRGGVVWRF